MHGEVNTFNDLDDLLNPPRSTGGPDTGGDHPDPVTLSEPAHDEQGLLRWSSSQLQRP